jgi:hypothetical protein
MGRRSFKRSIAFVMFVIPMVAAGAFHLAGDALASDDFTVLPVDEQTQDWFRGEVDGLCENPESAHTWTTVSEFRCANPLRAFDGSRAMLEGAGGLARRCARGTSSSLIARCRFR